MGRAGVEELFGTDFAGLDADWRELGIGGSAGGSIGGHRWALERQDAAPAHRSECGGNHGTVVAEGARVSDFG